MAKSNTRINDLTQPELELLSKVEPDFLFTHRPFWMGHHRPEWVAHFHPKWMLENHPSYMLANRWEWVLYTHPEIMARYDMNAVVKTHPMWAITHLHGQLTHSHPELIKAYSGVLASGNQPKPNVDSEKAGFFKRLFSRIRRDKKNPIVAGDVMDCMREFNRTAIPEPVAQSGMIPVPPSFLDPAARWDTNYKDTLDRCGDDPLHG